MARQGKAKYWKKVTRTVVRFKFTAFGVGADEKLVKYNGYVYGVKTETRDGIAAAIRETFPQYDIMTVKSFEREESVEATDELQYLGGKDPSTCEIVKEDENK